MRGMIAVIGLMTLLLALGTGGGAASAQVSAPDEALDRDSPAGLEYQLPLFRARSDALRGDRAKPGRAKPPASKESTSAASDAESDSSEAAPGVSAVPFGEGVEPRDGSGNGSRAAGSGGVAPAAIQAPGAEGGFPAATVIALGSGLLIAAIGATGGILIRRRSA